MCVCFSNAPSERRPVQHHLMETIIHQKITQIRIWRCSLYDAYADYLHDPLLPRNYYIKSKHGFHSHSGKVAHTRSPRSIWIIIIIVYYLACMARAYNIHSCCVPLNTCSVNEKRLLNALPIHLEAISHISRRAKHTANGEEWINYL